MRPRRCLPAVLLALMAAVQPAFGQDIVPAGTDKPKQEGPRTLRDPMAGAVLNRTVTVMGREFYQYFAAAWRDRDVGGRYSLSVHERPTAIRGSEMWVEYDDRHVFHAFLSPARAAVKEISRNAVDIAFRNVMDIDIQRVMVQQSDLGPEEI